MTLTDEQKHAVDHAKKVLRAVKLYDHAALLATPPAAALAPVDENRMRQYEHVGSGLTLDRCPCGYCEKTRAIFAASKSSTPAPVRRSSFWGTPEVDAASRDFGYDDYLMLCRAARSVPLCQPAYDLVKAGFNVQVAYAATKTILSAPTPSTPAQPTEPK